MRWDALRAEKVDSETLAIPGLGDGAVVRRFEAPEAMGIRFHEVRAKSVLNRVPGGAYGFNWTVNPYRGCAHACVYCLAPDTLVSMADGSYKAIADISPGEEILGTRREGAYRRYARTRVSARWQTIKPAYRVLLEDGTELIASADHRFLTRSGWKHVAGSEQGPARRPHLTLNDKLVGMGAAAPRAAHFGTALKSSARLGVVAIEPLGKSMPMFDITTGTGDFIANGVVSHNCFARPTHAYLGWDAGRDFEREIVVKVNTPERLRAELARPSWRRELVALGTNTDPYQWVEGRYRMMPEILAALEEAETPVSVLTKSPLALRDIEIFARMAERLPVSVNLSVPTLDEKVWRATEPRTPSPLARLEAVAELRRRGIESGVMIAPLMPGLNDAPEQVRPIVERAREAGASFVTGAALHLRGEVRDVFFGWLAAKRPDLLDDYSRLFADGRPRMPAPARRHTTRAVKGWGRRRPPAEGGPGRQDAAPAQPRLF